MNCSICWEEVLGHASKVPAALRKCGHVFHRSCVSSWLSAKSQCPECRAKNTRSDVIRLFLHADDDDGGGGGGDAAAGKSSSGCSGSTLSARSAAPGNGAAAAVRRRSLSCCLPCVKIVTEQCVRVGWRLCRAVLRQSHWSGGGLVVVVVACFFFFAPSPSPLVQRCSTLG